MGDAFAIEARGRSRVLCAVPR